MTAQEFITIFPRFRESPEMVGEILTRSRVQCVEADAQIYREGDDCSAIAFLLEGGIRVFKIAESGREITLYRIGPGETCILNASCIAARHPYPAHATTQERTRLLMVPAEDFRDLMERHDSLRSFVFLLLSQRLAEVMELVHEVAFTRMDERVYEYLVEKSEGRRLFATHQGIANELGTSREVVSRLLKEMERRGLLLLGRNIITLKSLEIPWEETRRTS